MNLLDFLWYIRILHHKIHKNEIAELLLFLFHMKLKKHLYQPCFQHIWLANGPDELLTTVCDVKVRNSFDKYSNVRKLNHDESYIEFKNNVPFRIVTVMVVTVLSWNAFQFCVQRWDQQRNKSIPLSDWDSFYVGGKFCLAQTPRILPEKLP